MWTMFMARVTTIDGTLNVTLIQPLSPASSMPVRMPAGMNT